MMSLLLAVLLGALPADEPQAKPAPPAAAAQDPDRPTISAAELKALRDNNIFAPKSAVKRPPKREFSGTRTPPTPVRPKAPQVTAIFLDSATQAYNVIVEDRNDASRRFFKDPKFMKAGDEWSGIKLESVTQDKAVFSRDGASKEVHIGEGIAEIDSKPLSSVTAENEGFEDGETPVPAETVTLPAPSGSSSTSPTAPGPSKKSTYRSRTESGAESKSAPPESQNRTLEEMKRRLKKNRPGDEQ